MYSNLISSLIFIILSVVLYINSFSLPKPRFDPLGSGFFPRVLFALMIILSLIQLAGALATLYRQRKSRLYHLLILAQVRQRLPKYRLIGAGFGLFALYVLALPYLGFLLATFLYLVAFQQLLHPRPLGQLPLHLVKTGVSTWLITYVFEAYFQVYLPPGIFS